VTLTLAGRAKALQRGIPVEELRASLEACVLCGACESVCPVEIDTVGMTLDLRAQLAEAGASTLAHAAARMPALTRAQGAVKALGRDSTPDAATGGWFLPGLALRSDPVLLRRVTAVLAKQGVRLAEDDGIDLRIALETGLPIDAQRRAHFLRPFQGARELIVGDGLLHRPLREWLPGTRVIGLGEALLRLAPARSALRPTDLYVIETRGYHAEFARLVRLYDRLRQTTGCTMNLDLQRAAIPTGAACLQASLGLGGLDVAAQTRWISEGWKIERIVIEDAADRAAFERTSTLPVVHLAELAEAEPA
jgi:ferredoxin